MEEGKKRRISETFINTRTIYSNNNSSNISNNNSNSNINNNNNQNIYQNNNQQIKRQRYETSLSSTTIPSSSSSSYSNSASSSSTSSIINPSRSHFPTNQRYSGSGNNMVGNVYQRPSLQSSQQQTVSSNSNPVYSPPSRIRAPSSIPLYVLNPSKLGPPTSTPQQPKTSSQNTVVKIPKSTPILDPSLKRTLNLFSCILDCTFSRCLLKIGLSPRPEGFQKKKSISQQGVEKVLNGTGISRNIESQGQTKIQTTKNVTSRPLDSSQKVQSINSNKPINRPGETINKPLQQSISTSLTTPPWQNKKKPSTSVTKSNNVDSTLSSISISTSTSTFNSSTNSNVTITTTTTNVGVGNSTTLVSKEIPRSISTVQKNPPRPQMKTQLSTQPSSRSLQSQSNSQIQTQTTESTPSKTSLNSNSLVSKATPPWQTKQGNQSNVKLVSNKPIRSEDSMISSNNIQSHGILQTKNSSVNNPSNITQSNQSSSITISKSLTPNTILQQQRGAQQNSNSPRTWQQKPNNSSQPAPINTQQTRAWNRQSSSQPSPRQLPPNSNIQTPRQQTPLSRNTSPQIQTPRNSTPSSSSPSILSKSLSTPNSQQSQRQSSSPHLSRSIPPSQQSTPIISNTPSSRQFSNSHSNLQSQQTSHQNYLQQSSFQKTSSNSNNRNAQSYSNNQSYNSNNSNNNSNNGSSNNNSNNYNQQSPSFGRSQNTYELSNQRPPPHGFHNQQHPQHNNQHNNQNYNHNQQNSQRNLQGSNYPPRPQNFSSHRR